MNLSLAELSKQPKHAIAFGALQLLAASSLVCAQPWLRDGYPHRLVNALDLASTILVLSGPLYVLAGIQSWRKAQADTFDTARETGKAGIFCIVAGALLFALGMLANQSDVPRWIEDVLARLSMGVFFIGALYAASGFRPGQK
ncbi:hypothetical protein FHS83_000986 [Rhizomicrobium palustre]|uniref:Uncharacterized protein n=1 Tax=Rhizomicrobium palustre TaxID=189966 RepID=A0A846MVT1_9PROT|nr:hypothetical protein [Rhizomicrobium palustre]NIK87668.1 hypothetical protein [Rhizomicrobium palustre]